jgi:hypothetical protein
VPAVRASPLAKTFRAKAFASLSVSNVLAVRFTCRPSGTKETYPSWRAPTLLDGICGSFLSLHYSNAFRATEINLWP